MPLDDFLSSFDAFHLWHGDIHDDDIRVKAIIFGDRSLAVSSFADQLAAKSFNDAGQVFAGEDGVIHYQVADWLAIFAFYCRELLHVATSPVSCKTLVSRAGFSPVLIKIALLPQ